jgi:hypothetical protein
MQDGLDIGGREGGTTRFVGLLCLLLSACSAPVASKSDPAVESAVSAEVPDAGPASEDAGPATCEDQCEQIGDLCDTLCTYQSDAGAQVASCKSTCAMAVLTQCLPYCPGFNLVICLPGHGCGDAGTY